MIGKRQRCVGDEDEDGAAWKHEPTSPQATAAAATVSGAAAAVFIGAHRVVLARPAVVRCNKSGLPKIALDAFPGLAFFVSLLHVAGTTSAGDWRVSATVGSAAAIDTAAAAPHGALGACRHHGPFRCSCRLLAVVALRARQLSAELDVPLPPSLPVVVCDAADGESAAVARATSALVVVALISRRWTLVLRAPGLEVLPRRCFGPYALWPADTAASLAAAAAEPREPSVVAADGFPRCRVCERPGALRTRCQRCTRVVCDNCTRACGCCGAGDFCALCTLLVVRGDGSTAEVCPDCS